MRGLYFLKEFDKFNTIMLELQADERSTFGKSVSVLRSGGLLPAELYGRGMPNKHLSLHALDFSRLYKTAGENTLVTLRVGKEQFPVLIHDVQYDYLTDVPVHVDFYGVRMDEKIQTKVPLVFTGESIAVKDAGGVLVKIAQELPVEALPGDIPREIIVSIIPLDRIGASIRVEDLSLPAGVRALVDGRITLVTVKAKMTEEEEVALAAKGTVEKVVVETEEKKAERDLKKTSDKTPEGGAIADAGKK